MDFNILATPISMYGIYQFPDGKILLNNTVDFIEGSILRQKTESEVQKFVDDKLEINKGLKTLENRNQTIPRLNDAILKKEGQSIGGRIFRIKQGGYKSKYL